MNDLVKEMYKLLQHPEHKEFFNFVRYDSIKKDVEDNKIIILRDDGGELIGFVTLHVYQTTSPVYKVKKNDVRIKQIVVNPDKKGQGYGKRMVELSEDYVNSIGGEFVCLSVEEHNTKALGFYDKMGFSVVNSGIWKKKNSGDVKYLVYRKKCN